VPKVVGVLRIRGIDEPWNDAIVIPEPILAGFDLTVQLTEHAYITGMLAREDLGTPTNVRIGDKIYENTQASPAHSTCHGI